MSKWEDQEPIALAYDDTDDELIAKVYTREAMVELDDAWWVCIEKVAANTDFSDGGTMTLKFDIETNGEDYKLIITEGATRQEAVGSRSEMRKLLTELYKEVGPEGDRPEYTDELDGGAQ